MATGFTVLDAINKNSKAGVDESPKARFRTKDISIFKMYRNDMNFYKVDDIEELAEDILMHGLKQNLELVYEQCENGEYRIIAGERRWEALKLLVSKGYKEFEIATCKLTSPQDADEEQIEIISANAYRTKSIAEMIEEEQRLKTSLERMRAAGKQIKGYDLNSGRLRDVIASLLQMSRTKVAQIESISNNLIPEFREELNKERLTFSAAYELSGMTESEQRDALVGYEESGELSHKDIKNMKDEKAAGQQEPKELKPVSESDTGQQEEETEKNVEELMNEPEEYEEPQPETVDSLCYSCNNYENCHEKKRTVTSCNAYINRTEAQKTDEQRYSEEQDKIDRETKKRLREMADEERMDNIPGKEQTGKKYLRAAGSLFERIMNGEQNFMILKNEGYKKGEKITVGEFSDGKETGRTLEIIISHMENDKTSSAIGDGYCVINAIMSPALNSLESKKQEPHEEPEEVQEQPPLPVLKNNEQRKEWLNKYQEWGLWYEDGNIGAKYYRYCFENGAELIVEEYQDHSEYAGDYTSSYFHLIGGPEAPRKSHGLCGWQRHDKYKKFPNSETELVEFLKFVQKGDK